MTSPDAPPESSVAITRKPTRIATAAALVAVAVAVAIAAASPAAPVAVAGAVGIGIGLRRGSDGLVDFGSLGLLGAVVVAGFSAPPEATLGGVVAVVVAWDLGCAAIALGEQLGREADTARLELRYVCSSLLAGLLAATLAYGAFLAGGGLPLDAVVVLLIVAVAATIALGARRTWNELGAGASRIG